MAIEISVCMIVKNEEDNLPRCLESIKDLADEIIVVDTGSTDKTVEIAKKYGAKTYFFKWCNNFSIARNESLKYATKDWILIMDADDEFSAEDKGKFRELVNNLKGNGCYYFDTICYFGDAQSGNMSVNLNPRLFKNHYGFKYEGAIHNQLINTENIFEGIYQPIKIFHYGYLDEDIINKDKHKRNITMLEEEIKRDPEEKFNYFNLGNEYFSLDDYEKALYNYKKAYKDFDPSTGFASKLIERIILAYHTLGQYEKAIEFCDIAINYYPDFTDIYYIKALILRVQEKPTLAIRNFEKCLELGEPSLGLRSIYGSGTFRASYELAQLYMQLKDYDTAYIYYVKTISFKPDYLVPLYNIAHILKEKSLPINEFKNKLEQFFGDFPKQYTIIADLFYLEGYYETALEYIEKYEKQMQISEELKFFKVKCLMRIGRVHKCISFIKSISKDGIYYFQIMMYKVLCFSMINNFEQANILMSKFNEEKLSDYNKKVYKVYKQYLNALNDKETTILTEDEKEIEYTSVIFEICEILLVSKEFDKFEKALNLLNLVSDKTVLLQLGKLYNKYGYSDMARQEIIRSIKLFDVMDGEGLDILKKTL